VAARASASIDVIRGEVGLDQDDGASLLTSPTFTSFPASLDGDAPPGPAMSLFRVRTTRESVRPDRPVPAWAIDDGRPLVFVTFGTLAAGSAKNHGLFRAALDAVAALPVRALMSTGAEMDKSVLGVLPANVTVESWVPQGDIFPRASALVCRGGSGTLLAGLAHGLPMVIVPLTADQPDNARRVEAVGAGVTILDHDAMSLRAAIEQVIRDPTTRIAADRMAHEMAALATMDDAVRELERLGGN
jgi:MGT family glycosyltransferase